VAELREALLGAVTPDDLAAIVHALVARAKSGDVAAAREVLDRCLGRPVVLGLVAGAVVDDAEPTVIVVEFDRGG